MKDICASVLALVVLAGLVWLGCHSNTAVSSRSFGSNLVIIEDAIAANASSVSALPGVSVDFEIDKGSLGLGGTVEYRVTAPWWISGYLANKLRGEYSN